MAAPESMIQAKKIIIDNPHIPSKLGYSKAELETLTLATNVIRPTITPPPNPIYLITIMLFAIARPKAIATVTCKSRKTLFTPYSVRINKCIFTYDLS
jgi:hypothetical protein